MPADDATKTRLLEAAGEEFADKGFGGATVRAICARAGANVAAINYHFGDKERLYIEAVIEAHRCGACSVDRSVGTRERFDVVGDALVHHRHDRLSRGWRQCLHYKLARPISRQLVGDDAWAELMDLDYLADHIAGVMLAALGIGPPLDFAGDHAPSPLAPIGVRR